MQAAAHYMTLEERLYVDLGPGERRSIDLEWEGYGGLLEAGIKYPLSEHLSLAPSLGIGISRLKNEASFNNLEPNDFDNPESFAQLFDWQTNASVARAHLGLLYENQSGNFQIKSAGHLSYSYINSFSESRGFTPFDNHASNFTAKLDIRHPTGINLREQSLFWVGHLGATAFLGSGRDALGFDHFYELGASLGISKYTLGLLLVTGADVEGLSLTFNYDY